MNKIESCCYDERLMEMYAKWLKEADDSFFGEDFSNPYFMKAPADWDDKKYRVMIVGEEGNGVWGAGKGDGWNPKTAEGMCHIMQFNEEYLQTQVIIRQKSNGYKYNRSNFWRRMRAISDLSKDISIAWSNLDKFHHRKSLGCKLSSEERALLHQTSIKVLAEEINILRPTHIIFFGWYSESLKAEIPNLFAELYKNKTNWQNTKMETIKTEAYTALFTYHPSWRGKYRPEGYEEKVIETIKNSLQ